jgi:hypothetical protein
MLCEPHVPRVRAYPSSSVAHCSLPHAQGDGAKADEKDDGGWTALMKASIGHKEIVEYLVVRTRGRGVYEACVALVIPIHSAHEREGGFVARYVRVPVFASFRVSLLCRGLSLLTVADESRAGV